MTKSQLKKIIQECIAELTESKLNEIVWDASLAKTQAGKDATSKLLSIINSVSDPAAKRQIQTHAFQIVSLIDKTNPK